MKPEIKVTYKEAIKIYMQLTNQVEKFHFEIANKLMQPDCGTLVEIDYSDAGEVSIWCNTCPLIMQFEHPDCLDDLTLRCTVKEKNPRPDDECFQMDLWYPGSFISNESRLVFALGFFSSTSMLKIMRLIDKETALQQSRL